MIWTNICAIFLRSVGEHERSECEHQFWKKNLPNGRLCLYFKIWFLVQWTMRVISLILRVIYIVCTLTFLLSKFSLKIKSIGGSQWESVYVYMTTHNFWKMLATSRHKIIYKFVMDLCKFFIRNFSHSSSEKCSCVTQNKFLNLFNFAKLLGAWAKRMLPQCCLKKKIAQPRKRSWTIKLGDIMKKLQQESLSHCLFRAKRFRLTFCLDVVELDIIKHLWKLFLCLTFCRKLF